MCEAAIESTDLLIKTKWDKLLKEHKEGFQLDLHDYSEITLDVIGKAGFGVVSMIFNKRLTWIEFWYF